MRSMMSIIAAAWLCMLYASFTVHAASAAAGSQPLLHAERVGVPFPAWTSPVYGSVSTDLLANPNLTRNALLAPRFHRMLRYGQDHNAKTQTAIFLAGRTAADEVRGSQGASVISALNPRDGGIVWRSLRNETDPVQSIHLSSDVLFTISGVDQMRATLLHALTGAFVWSSTMPTRAGAAHNGLIDAAFIPPPLGGRDPSQLTVANIAPDVIAMDRSGSLFRFAGVNGALIWRSEPLAEKSDAQTVIPLKMQSDRKHIIVASIVRQSKSGVFSSGDVHTIRVSIVQATNGASIATFDVPSSDVDMSTPFADYDSTSNLLIVGKDAESSLDRPPHVVWLHTDGTVKSFKVPLSEEASSVHVEAASIRTLKPKQSSRFNALVDIAKLRNRGILVARTNNGRAEVLRVTRKEKHLDSVWEMEEEAWDSVFFGGVDRQNRPYLNRAFFGRAQHLLNFHTMWVDNYDEQGQVTGASFQWDHDLNGDVLAAPFEVSPGSEFQLVWRSAFVTRSGSVRMLQDEKHQWIREEGLSHTTASIMIDLPESKAGTGKGSDVRRIIEGEGFIHRLSRHLIELQSMPSLTYNAVLKLAREIPNLSLDSFGIAPKVPSILPSSAPLPVKTGAAPLRGVGAQKLGGTKNQGRVRKMPGVPSGQSRTTRTAVEDEGPPPPAHLAPREANTTIVSKLIRDTFGLRKLIVSTTKAGKIYAIDSQTGSVVWEKSLFGFGQGEGASVPTIDVKLLALVRPVAGSGVDIGTPIGQTSEELTSHQSTSQLDYGGLLTIVAAVYDEGAIFTRMWQIEPLTGRFPGGADSQTGLALFPGAPKDAFLLPLEDESSGQIAAAAVSEEDKFLLWPTTPSIQRRFAEMGSSLFYATSHAVQKPDGSMQDVLTGYTPVSAPDVRGEQVWRLPLPSGERLVSITRAIQDPVASQGRVLGNRQTLYKYLNPHMLLVLTKSLERRSASVYVVDGVTGKILHHAVLAQGNLAITSPSGAEVNPKAVLTENWATIAYEVDISADDDQARYHGAHRQSRLVSFELYETLDDGAEKWNWKGFFSSFSKASSKVSDDAEPVTVFSQIFTLPYGVRAMSATRTKLGVSSKAIILATTQNRLQVLPRRLLDPRRPLNRKPTTNEMEEGLMTYSAALQDSGKFSLGGRSIPSPGRVIVKPSLLESTGVILVDQDLDLFVTTVAASGSFDILSQSFNKLQLMLTMIALTVGLMVIKPMVSSKMLKMRW